MTKPLQRQLTPEKGLIFRITHRENLPWILRNGLHCSQSATQDPRFESIGNPELIAKRRDRSVPIPPGGTLAWYIPFYFTPYTPMLYNVLTGHGGIRRREKHEIVILVSSLPRLEDHGIRYVFTDRHAYLRQASYSAERADLDRIDWELLRERDFQRDPEDPEKIERYQAEALVYQHLPVTGLLGLTCYNQEIQREVQAVMNEHGTELKTFVRPRWFFR